MALFTDGQESTYINLHVYAMLSVSQPTYFAISIAKQYSLGLVQTREVTQLMARFSLCCKEAAALVALAIVPQSTSTAAIVIVMDLKFCRSMQIYDGV